MPPLDEEAFQVDAYLDQLLATAALPVAEAGPPLDEELRKAAETLRRTLVRFHPSFRFEERLAAELAATAGVPPWPAPSAPAGAVEPLLLPLHGSAGGSVAVRDARGRLLLSGAIASGVSLAGAALFAWRRTRPPASAFGRAARAAHSLQRGPGRRPLPGLGRERLA